jgi:hypothetical protein
MHFPLVKTLREITGKVPLLTTPPPTPVETVINAISLTLSAIAWYSAQAPGPEAWPDTWGTR